jgi:chromosome segregation ATPase
MAKGCLAGLDGVAARKMQQRRSNSRREERSIMTTAGSHIDKNVSKLEAQLELWKTKLDEAVARAKDTGEQAKDDSRRHLDELKSKLEAARSKLDDAKAAGSEKWDTLRHGVEQAWQDLERTFKKIVH